MLEIKDIVNVVINRETTSKTVADLQTIAILSVHANYTENEMYREYTSTTNMLEDGFLTTDYAYVAAQRIFSQNPQVRSIVVGKITQASTEDAVDYVKEITNLQAATNDWFFLLTDAKDDTDKEAIADYIETQTAVYVFSDSNTNTLLSTNETDIFSVLKAKTLVKSFGYTLKTRLY